MCLDAFLGESHLICVDEQCFVTVLFKSNKCCGWSWAQHPCVLKSNSLCIIGQASYLFG